LKIISAVSLRVPVPSLSHLSYLERLSALGLEPLELRHLKFDLIQYYKVLNNLTCIKLNSCMLEAVIKKEVEQEIIQNSTKQVIHSV